MRTLIAGLIGATLILTATVGGEPSPSAQHYRLGVQLHNSGHPRDAIIQYTRAIQHEPTNTDAHIRRSFAYLHAGDYWGALEAVAELDQALFEKQREAGG